MTIFLFHLLILLSSLGVQLEDKEELKAKVHAAASVIANGTVPRSQEEALNQYVILLPHHPDTYYRVLICTDVAQNLHLAAVWIRLPCGWKPRHGGRCDQEAVFGR